MNSFLCKIVRNDCNKLLKALTGLWFILVFSRKYFNILSFCSLTELKNLSGTDALNKYKILNKMEKVIKHFKFT